MRRAVQTNKQNYGYRHITPFIKAVFIHTLKKSHWNIKEFGLNWENCNQSCFNLYSVSSPSPLYSSYSAVDITLPLDVALCVVINLYKYTAWPQLRRGAATCRSCWCLEMKDAQSSKERWEIFGDKNLFALGGEQRWGFCLAELFPALRTLILHFWCLLCGTSWEENPCRDDAVVGYVVGYVHCQCLSHFFHPISARLGDDHCILPTASPGDSLQVLLC